MKIHSVTGANGLPFEDNYWQDIYGDGLDVDGTFNAKEHALYIKSLFKLMNVPVTSLCDIGFGKGVLLKEFVRAFKPARVLAVDPSMQMVQELVRKSWVKNSNIAVRHSPLKDLKVKTNYTLTIFNSVAQYIPDDLPAIFENLAGFTKYVYFSVPTDRDYTRMKQEIRFEDPYAFKRSKKEYLAAISPWFNLVSYNLLEKKRSGQTFNDDLFVG